LALLFADFGSGTLSASLLSKVQRGLSQRQEMARPTHRCPTPMPLSPGPSVSAAVVAFWHRFFRSCW